MTTATKTIDRRKYIGGSDAGAILNRNDYRGRQKVWSDKVYGEDDTLKTRRPIMRGNTMEEIVEQMVRDEVEPLINSPEMFAQYHVGEPDDPQIYLFNERGEGEAPIGGHPDGISPGVLWELKAPSMYVLETIKTNGVPESWIFQVQHYMMLSGLPQAKIVALDYDGWSLYIVDVDADPDLHQRMLEEYDDFWFYVQNEIQPPMLDEEIDLFATQNTERLDTLLEQYVEATDRRYRGKDDQASAKGKIMTIIGDTPVVHTERYTVSQSVVDRGHYSYNRLVVRPR